MRLAKIFLGSELWRLLHPFPMDYCNMCRVMGTQRMADQRNPLWKPVRGFIEGLYRNDKTGKKIKLHRLQGQVFTLFFMVFFVKLINSCFISPHSSNWACSICLHISLDHYTHQKHNSSLLAWSSLDGCRLNGWTRQGATFNMHAHTVSRRRMDSHRCRKQQFGPTGSNRPPIPSLFFNATDYSH